MKKILFIPLLIIAVIFILILVWLTLDKKIDYAVATANIKLPEFKSEYLDFEHKLNESESLPFTGSAVIDIDNDGVEELFIGGGPNQQDVFFKYADAQFTLLEPGILDKQAMEDATFGASVIDVDKNGFSDLIVSRSSGVWLYLNQDGRFKGNKLNLPLAADTSPLSVAIGDVNRDGHFDMYVAGYIKKELVAGQTIFNQEGYGGLSVMLLNNGDNTFTDITESSGLYYKHNTFMAVFVDVDNDRLEDLVVAHDTGHVKTWRNMGGLKFRDMENPSSQQYAYPMGIAVTDYDNDGNVDFFFSNVGSTTPGFLVRGDLRKDQLLNRKWMMFYNKGNFEFDDIAEKVKLADYEFSWGAVFEDFNLDGRDDLVVSENYIGFAPHKIPFLRLPGRFLVQTETGEFAAVGKQSNVINANFGIAPLSADFNNDGYPDLVHINIDGKSKVFMNQGGDANYLKVKLPDRIESIAAKIQVTRSDGTVLFRDFVSGEGLGSDQSHIQIFGLADQQATKVIVNYLDGQQDIKTGSFVNVILEF